MRIYVSSRTKALLPKVTVGMMSTGFTSVQPSLKLLARWRPQPIHELLQGPLMHKDTNLCTTGSLKTQPSITLPGIIILKQCSSIVIGLIPIMILKKTNLAWLKSNTRISCVVATHLSFLTRSSKCIICRTHVKR
jgi:hypothetical protein